jgi:hypothetical protein
VQYLCFKYGDFYVGQMEEPNQHEATGAMPMIAVLKDMAADYHSTEEIAVIKTTNSFDMWSVSSVIERSSRLVRTSDRSYIHQDPRSLLFSKKKAPSDTFLLYCFCPQHPILKTELEGPKIQGTGEGGCPAEYECPIISHSLRAGDLFFVRRLNLGRENDFKCPIPFLN